jgi:Serine/threonine protein kinase
VGTLEACELFLDIASALSYAHEKGVVHRDIKPGNIVLVQAEGGRGYKAKLLDFGIAKLTGKQDYKQQEITNAGEVVGSPLYMSPEQCSGGEVDERSDVYSLGCTIYETMTGTPPFRGQNVMETVMKHFNEKPPTLASRMPGEYIPPRLEQLIQKAMAKSPDDRYQSMRQMGQELEDIRRTLEINLNADQQEAARKATNTTIRIDEPDKRQRIREEDNRRRLTKTAIISVMSIAAVLAAWQSVTAYLNSKKRRRLIAP